MGGYGSSRWGVTVTRVSTENLLRLDVRVLAREGCLQPGMSATVAWDSGTSITTEVMGERSNVVVLRYLVRSGNRSRLSMQEDISLMRTPCTFGGTRIWFVCPGCSTRPAVLYALAGYFRCRTCHQLAYPSTRSTT